MGMAMWRGETDVRRPAQAAFAAVVVLVCSACTMFVKTEAVVPSRAKQVPENRLYAYQSPFAGAAKVTFTRDEGVMGGACFIAIEVGGKVIASFDPGETATFYMRPGVVEMAVVPGPESRGLCALNPEMDRAERSLSANSENRFRLGVWAFRGARIVRIDPSTR
jgi:hypothetical protein